METNHQNIIFNVLHCLGYIWYIVWETGSVYVIRHKGEREGYHSDGPVTRSYAPSLDGLVKGSCLVQVFPLTPYVRYRSSFRKAVVKLLQKIDKFQDNICTYFLASYLRTLSVSRLSGIGIFVQGTNNCHSPTEYTPQRGYTSSWILITHPSVWGKIFNPIRLHVWILLIRIWRKKLIAVTTMQHFEHRISCVLLFIIIITHSLSNWEV
jgi:hypothetical protein